ncbi:MAG: glycosyltransferase family 4 protein [Elusimicrobia bacterium]|nr:glycosyltransferase family 4 protein [Elusimicrobiota bacterium]
MSWISGARRRPLLTVFLLALALRAGLAVVTERAPLMPEYYFTDARYADEMALDVLASWREGRSHVPAVSPAKRLHAVALAGLYSVTGFHPLAAKLANALLGAAAVLVFAALASLVFGPRRAVLAGLAVAVWPSHVFMTSQNFKDGPAMLCAFASLWLLVRSLTSERLLPAALASAAGAACLLLTGFQRAYLLAAISCAAAAAAGLALRERRRVLPALLCLAAAVSAPLAYRPLSAALFSGSLQMTVRQEPGGLPPSSDPGLVPGDEAGTAPSASPRWNARRLSDLRRSRQLSDQAWAQIYKGRRIGTQLFYGVEFHDWLDVAAFLPKGAFYALFMPLPGLYPLEGNPGRILASLENLVLLALACAGAAAFLTGPKTPARILLMSFFLIMTTGSALLEFDLGSASRHKLTYLPMLLAFAASLVSERRPPAPGRRKVFEVLECGGPGGTGNQVAAICNGLDPAGFEVGLVYAVRDGRPAEYRALAKGAVLAFHVPEMTREIAPIMDLAAFTRLHALFKREAPDVVHTHSSKAGVLARLAAWTAGVPLVFHSPRGYGFLQQDRSMAARLLYWTLEASASWIGTVVAVSPSEARLAGRLTWGAPVATVCDPYLGKALACVPAREGGLAVAACGRLTYARHPEAFVRLAKGLAESRPDARFVWVGGGDGEDRLRGELKSLGLDGRFELTGWLDPAAALEKLSAADVFVHYSRWEGLPNAVLEAMALGLPVIASDVPGNRDAVLHGETGFIAADETALKERVLELAGDPELRRRLGHAGRKRVREAFSPSATFAALSGLYSRTS